MPRLADLPLFMIILMLMIVFLLMLEEVVDDLAPVRLPAVVPLLVRRVLDEHRRHHRLVQPAAVYPPVHLVSTATNDDVRADGAEVRWAREREGERCGPVWLTHSGEGGRSEGRALHRGCGEGEERLEHGVVVRRRVHVDEL